MTNGNTKIKCNILIIRINYVSFDLTITQKYVIYWYTRVIRFKPKFGITNDNNQHKEKARSTFWKQKEIFLSDMKYSRSNKISSLSLSKITHISTTVGESFCSIYQIQFISTTSMTILYYHYSNTSILLQQLMLFLILYTYKYLFYFLIN